MATQRVTGEAFAGTLNEQLSPSTLRPVLPTANAVPVVPMQNTRTTAATTLMIDLMRNPLQIEPFTYCGIGFGAESHETTGLERYQSEKVDLLIAEKPWMRCRSEGPRPLLIRA
jgi:hypothetical protein